MKLLVLFSIVVHTLAFGVAKDVLLTRTASPLTKAPHQPHPCFRSITDKRTGALQAVRGGDEMRQPALLLNRMNTLIPSFSFGLLAIAPIAMAAEDIEYAELPPPYIPVAFGLLLLVGVGLLTGSLGNVMDEEASLGLQSGARAKKEIERSRSSYFKKR